LDKYLKDGNYQEAGNTNLQTRTVLFVEQTRGGELAKRLRSIGKRTENMMGFRTKIVEGVGSKLKNLLPNSNPWKGVACSREGCIPCAQPGDRKQDCRKRNIIYESKCVICNPEKEKFQKDGKDLEDKREDPSIYVGESGRSLYERSKEHWADFESKAEDSHILKHWLTHHCGQGQPDFRLEVVKYCRDTLSRQVGEAIRIQYRGNTLNSKAGYNRSGLSRLVLPEKEERQSIQGKEPECSSGMDSTAEPRGLNMLSQVPTGGKRKDHQHKDIQPRSKKRKKMKYETLEDDWGMGAGEDLERLEMYDSARRKFLMDGRMDKLASSKSRQTTIRVWTLEESLCREILENLVEGAVKKSTFMKNLQETLEMAWVSRQEPLDEEIIPEGRNEKEPDVPDGRKQADEQDAQEKETSPDGWKGDEPEVVRRARTTGGTDHLKSQVVKGTIQAGGKGKRILELFRSQEKRNQEKFVKELEKEERLEVKKRLENTWKLKKSHYDHLRWAKDPDIPDPGESL
jgi:hypothetical protein